MALAISSAVPTRFIGTIWARRWARSGSPPAAWISVSIRPGLIDTEIHASGGEPDRAHRLAHMVPMQRVGTADEIANAIVWLMSDEASYVTSAVLDVSGGR